MPSLDLGKVRKFQPRSSSRFGDIPEKPEGVDENNPPLPLIGLSVITQLIHAAGRADTHRAPEINVIEIRVSCQLAMPALDRLRRDRRATESYILRGDDPEDIFD